MISTSTRSPLIHILDDSIQALGLDQVVDQPTHKNGNILDLIMIEDWHNDREYKVQVGDFLLDHKFVSLQLSLIKKCIIQTCDDKEPKRAKQSIL